MPLQLGEIALSNFVESPCRLPGNNNVTVTDGADPLHLASRPYRGALTSEQLARGMTAANHNAARLLEDAELLLGAGRWPSAAALAIHAVEETAKEEILRALATWPSEAKVFWRAFTSHKQKGDLALMAWVDDDQDVMTLLVLALVAALGVVGQSIEAAKWRALYVECLIDGDEVTWWAPEAFGEGEALAMVETARRVVRRRVVTPEEVRILIRHVAPVAGATWNEVNAAQARYLREVVDRGLREREPWMRTRLGVDPWAGED